MALPPLPSDDDLLATLGDLQDQQPSLRHRWKGFSVDPSPNTLPGDDYHDGLLVTKTLGPYQDPIGRIIVVDVLLETIYVPVQFVGQPTPCLWIEQPRRITGTPANHAIYTIASGRSSSVWISSTLFSSDTASSDAVGLRVAGGHLQIDGLAPSNAIANPDSITVPANANLTLSLQLIGESQSVDATLPANEYAVATPQHVTFRLLPTSIALIASDQAVATVFGTQLNLSYSATTAVYDSTLNRVGFAFSSDTTVLNVRQTSSQLLTWTGQTRINNAFWSLAIAPGPDPASPKSLFPTSGAGGICLDVQTGLSVSVHGQDRPIICGAAKILAQGSTLLITGANATGGFSRKQKIQIQAQSDVILNFPQSYPFRYVDQFNGSEAFNASIDTCSVKLDQPRTVNGNPFAFEGWRNLILLLRDSNSTSCMVHARFFGDIPSPPTWSFALKNLLITARFPTLTAFGPFDVSTSAMSNSTIRLALGVPKSTPILPDPYTSNVQTISTGPVIITLTTQVGGKSTISEVSFSGITERSLSSISESSISVDRPTSENSLLDLSSNFSQFGVAFATGVRTTPKVKDLYLTNPAQQVAVMALPAVQWEPVTTSPNPDGFPSPLTFPDCGPITIVSARNTTTLVPITPDQAIESVLSLYQANPSSNVVAQFTLPFGLVARAQLTRSILPLLPSPTLTKVNPSFSSQKLQSAHQLSIRGPGRRIIIGSPPHLPPAPSGTTSIPGTVKLLRNALSGNQTASTTVLGVISDTFDSTFNQSPGIPVTRIDISGYGESMFSDWRNPDALPGTISKVAFDVMIGRTAREVVQAHSILYPYGVAVIRDITIERHNTGLVIRKDSGWQAVSDGHYQFPVPQGAPSLVTHPGLIKSVVSVRNIRDLGAGQMYTLIDPAGNIELMPVKFDCFINIENVVAGRSTEGVPALDQLGYVQITKSAGAGSLTASQYSTLINDRSPLGGAIDCVTNIGNSGLLVRIQQVRVGASRSSAAIEFAMTAYGGPVLPKAGPGGQWAFLYKTRNEDVLRNVSAADGVPLIQQNPIASAIQPYRFADPSDILIPDTPNSDYGLVFSTPGIKLLFLRPRIIPTAPFQITSTMSPLLADVFVLNTTAGPFPATESCIPIADTSWNLAISQTGQLTLHLSSPNFTTTSIRRVLRDNPNLRSISYTSNEASPPVPSTVTLSLDSSNASWSCKITNLSLCMETADYGEVLRVVGTLSASSSKALSFDDTRIIFGPKLSIVTKLVSFLENLNAMPPMKYQTNSTSWQASGVMNLQKALSVPGQNEAMTEFMEKFVIDMDFKILAYSSEDDTTMEVGGDITFKFPVGAGMVVFLGAVDLKMRSDGNIWSITVGAGYGYDIDLVKPIEGYAYAALAFHLTIGDKVLGYGGSILIKADVDLVVIEATATIEARVDHLTINCGPNNQDRSVFAVSQVHFALEITIFLVADIEFDYSHQWVNNMDQGPCPLPDNVV